MDEHYEQAAWCKVVWYVILAVVIIFGIALAIQATERIDNLKVTQIAYK